MTATSFDDYKVKAKVAQAEADANIKLGAILAPFALAFVAAAIVVRGYVGSIMWGWFAVPLGAPLIGVAHAIGLAFLARAFLGSRLGADDEEAKPVRMIVHAFLVPFVALGAAWIARGFAFGF